MTNQSGGTISGVAVGVFVGGAGTVTNSGTISGAASVVFAGSGTHTLTLQTGSTLTGAATGSTASGATNALILQGQGTANNNFVNFKTLNAQGSGNWTLGGNSTFGDTMVSSGTLSVTGALTSTTLEIASAGQLNDAGAVTVTGAVTNRGNLTINGVTMRIVSAGGTFTQLAGGTTTLLNGGVLDPSNIVVQNGVFGGSGSMVGDVSITGGTVEAGGGPGGSLKILGNYSQTGGEIVFDIDPNGVGGFLETTLNFDPSFTFGISNTKIVFDFLDGANAQQFVADGLLDLNTFFGLTGDSPFCSELNCGTRLSGYQLRQQRSWANDHGIRSRERRHRSHDKRRAGARNMGAAHHRDARPWRPQATPAQSKSDNLNAFAHRDGDRKWLACTGPSLRPQSPDGVYGPISTEGHRTDETIGSSIVSLERATTTRAQRYLLRSAAFCCVPPANP